MRTFRKIFCFVLGLAAVGCFGFASLGLYTLQHSPPGVANPLLALAAIPLLMGGVGLVVAAVTIWPEDALR